MIRVFYWKDSKYLVNNLVPSSAEFKRDYERVYVSKTIRGSELVVLSRVYDLLNSEENPLGTPAMQEWIGTNLQPSPHTSMSVGDIVELDNGTLMLTLPVGWQRLAFKAVNK